MQNRTQGTKDTVRQIAQDVFVIWKQVGETPLQALERLRTMQKIDTAIPMTYAGRLDPLAEGQLLILVGDECKKKEYYLGLDKEYEVEILLGVRTDTGDVMGKIVEGTKLRDDSECIKHKDNLEKVLQTFIGKVFWPYPVFSSKTVQGKPLFLWALEGRLNEIDEIPMRESEIYELELLSTSTTKLSISQLREQVHMKIKSIPKVPAHIVNGEDTKKLGADFRRKEVLQSWADFFEKCTLSTSEQTQVFDVIKVRCACSSGTYMRTLAQKIGEALGVPALALSIVRTKIMI